MFDLQIKVNDIILFLSVVATVVIYCKRRNDIIRSAAISVKYQIKEIEKNIEYLRKFCTISSSLHSIINEQEWFISNPIFTQNKFEIYSAELVPYLTHDEYEQLISFYNTASVLLRLQNDVKGFSMLALSSRGTNYYNAAYGYAFHQDHSEVKTIQASLNGFYTSSNDITVNPYVPFQYGVYFDKYITEYKPLTGTVLFDKLEKLSNSNIFILMLHGRIHRH
ncbi:hypothetical protein [Succinimonas sp.]|uniref:hypothetical protein n=1 Tax=Succinimonas sp. TaxID=1936151 RepID=UPI00386E2D8D